MTGGVGCGKSEVLAYLENAYGAVILRTDDLAKELMMPGEACYQDVLALFGPDVLQEDGMLDRVKMAEKVFADEKLLQKLNAVTHPAVLARTEEIIRDASGSIGTETQSFEATIEKLEQTRHALEHDRTETERLLL